MSEMNHTIAKMSWNTSFDCKEKAFELQERLSAWSKNRMPLIANEIFTKCCPSTQTWKIEDLEINLGKIDFENLESALSKEVSQQLKQKLIELMINNNTTNNQVDLIENINSVLQVLRYYLLHGLLPWNHRESNGSINEMLEVQLKQNLNELVYLLREVGAANPAVRKRVAWQSTLANIHQMVKGLEPYHHKTIIDFSEEMIQIKNRENRIKGDARDFTKNLWHWIFNYLLAERGTMFNKIAFVKSNIKQMASHFNISYEELLNILNEAVNLVVVQKYGKQEMALIINTLVLEKSTGDTKQIEKTVAEWDLLKHYLLNHRLSKTRLQKEEFNDLVISLSRANASAFSSLILSIPKRASRIAHWVSVLDRQSLTAVLLGFNSHNAKRLLESLHFLDLLGQPFDPTVNLEIGINYLNQHWNNTFNQSAFLSYYIGQLSKKTGLSQQKITAKLLAVHISSSRKTMLNLLTYTELVGVLEKRRLSEGRKPNVAKLLDQLTLMLSEVRIDPEKLRKISAELQNNLKQNSRFFLATLTVYTRKDTLKRILPYFITHEDSILLLQHAIPEHVAIFTAFQKIAKTFIKVKVTHDFASWLLKKNAEIALDVLIFQPKLSHAAYIRFLLIKLNNQLPARYSSSFEQFVYVLAKENHPSFASVNHIFLKNKKQVAIQHLFELIAAKENERIVVDVLALGLKRKEFRLVDLQNHPQHGLLINYLLHRGQLLFRALLKEYTTLLVQNNLNFRVAVTSELISQFFWNCLIAYSHHQGNNSVFEQQFRQVMSYKFELGKFETDGRRALLPVQKQEIWLHDQTQRPAATLFLVLEEFLKKGLRSKVGSGATLTFYDLLRAALASDAGRVRRMITSFKLNTVRMEAWSTTVPFDEFSLWMANAESEKANLALKSLRTLFVLTEYLMPGKMPVVLLHRFWSLMWMVLKTERLSLITLKGFVQEILFEVSKQRSLNTASLLLEIQHSKLEVPALLTKAMSAVLPNFSTSKQVSPAHPDAKALGKTATKGLLYPLIKGLILIQKVPLWFGERDELTTASLMNELVASYPLSFFEVLRQENIAPFQLQWLNENLKFNMLTKAIANLNSAYKVNLQLVADLYASLRNFRGEGISGKVFQQLLFNKVVNSWTTDNLKTLAPENIWQEMIWAGCIEKGLTQKKLIGDLTKIKHQFPAALQLTLTQLEEQQHKLTMKPKKEVDKRKDPAFALTDDVALLKDSIYIQNAGLVLINHYIPMLFERLGIIDSQKYFVDEKQLDAVHYLQYVAVGDSQTDEPYLALNKILCGIPLNQPIKNEISIPTEHKVLVEELIMAMIGYWPEIGSSSIDGFRGNWLIRNGLLIEYEDKWELTIEKRAYDLLIHKSPFTFSIIKYPWMKKPLYVQWPH